jgi:F-type H+-transporting ATPase subunit delta
MQGVSAQSLAAVLEAVDDVLDKYGDPEALGRELFEVVDVLDSQPTLRRIFTDSSIEESGKNGLLRDVLEGKVSDAALDLMTVAVARRWNEMRDLADAVEQAGVTAYVVQAQRTKQLDELEDELFRFARIVEAEPRLRDVLGDRTAPLSAKRKLLDGLIKDKVSEPTRLLLAEAVAGRHRSFLAAVADYQRIAAARRDRLVATVHVAAPLSRDQERRLSKALADEYGHAVHVNVVVDPRLLGGVRATVEDEVVDSTIATRLEDARRKLAG